MSTIQIRIDKKTKNMAQRILKNLGIDMSAAIKMFLQQVILKKGLPFLVLTENGLTPQEEQEILKAAEDAKKGINVTPPMNVDEALKYLDDLCK